MKHFVIGYIVVIFQFFSPSVHAQSLNHQNQSGYQYVYAIEPDEAELFLTNQWQLNGTDFSQRPVLDSFPRFQEIPQLAPGHYLLARVDQKRLNLLYHAEHTMKADVLNNGKELNIKVWKLGTGEAVENAKVSLDGKQLEYNTQTKIHRRSHTYRSGLVRIEVDNEVLFYQLESKHPRFTPMKRVIRRIAYTFPLSIVSRPISRIVWGIKNGGMRGLLYAFKPRKRRPVHFVRGISMTNQPKYRHGDTLKVKAQVVTKRNRPYNGTLQARLYSGYNYKTYTLGAVEPDGSGAYSYEMVLGDTLPIDTRYCLQFFSKTGKEVTKAWFRIEDYWLREVRYEIESNQETYEEEEPITLTCSAHDFNDLMVPDARVEIKVTTLDIEAFFDEHVRVPKSLWDTTFNLDPNASDQITIPKELLPRARLKLKVNARFNNSNNETKDTTFTLKYHGNPYHIRSTLTHGIVEASYYESDQQLTAEGTLVQIANYDTILKETIQFPYSGSLNPLATDYWFTTSTAKNQLAMKEEESAFQVYGQRNNDSVFFNVINPHQLQFSYEIFKGDRSIATGEGHELAWKSKDGSQEVYGIEVHYWWAGTLQKETAHAAVFNKRLTLEVAQSAVTNPGAEEELIITAKTPKGKPVEDVELIVGATNSQFEEDEFPAIPYYGKPLRGKKTKNSYELTPKGHFEHYDVPLDLLKRYQLMELPYYQLYFPNENGTTLYDSTGGSYASFAAYAVHQGKQLAVQLIYVDDRPVYLSTQSSVVPYAMVVDTGYHRLEIRLRDSELTWDSVYFQAGYKLELSVDTAALPDGVSKKSTFKYPSAAELNLFNNMTLTIHRNQDKAYCWQGDRVWPVQKRQGTIRVAPVQHDDFSYALVNGWKTDFDFTAGYDYEIEDGLIKLFNSDKRQVWQGWPSNRINPFFQRAVTLETMQLEEKEVTRYNHRYERTREAPYMAKYRFEYTGDSTFHLLRFERLGKDPDVLYTKGWSRFFYNLKTGHYRLTLFTPDGYYVEKDSIYLERGSLVMERFGDLEYHHLQEHRIHRHWNDSTLLHNKLKEHLPTLNGSTLMGTVLDSESEDYEPIPFVNVRVEQNGVPIFGTYTDFEGKYQLDNLPPGTYDLHFSYIGYKSKLMEGVTLKEGKLTIVDTQLGIDGLILQEVQVASISMSLPSFGGERDVAMYLDQVPGVVTGELQEVKLMASMVTISNNGVFAAVVNANGNLPSENESTTVDSTSANTGQSGIRTDFRDYAYFERATTDQNGQARINVKYPDKNTAWNTYIYALGKRKLNGMSRGKVKSYKTLYANLQVPRFLLEGDSTTIVGKSLNYRGDSIAVQTQFKLGEEIVQQNSSTIGNVLIETFSFTVSSPTTILTYLLQDQAGYFDGEQKEVPIYPLGIEHQEGFVITLENNEPITIDLDTFDADAITLSAVNNKLDVLLQSVAALERYPYYCMEQTSSKLRGYLAKAQIKKALGQPFTDERVVKKLINRLEKGQRDDGTWGWWMHSSQNLWMTCYVMETLSLAKQEGYTVKGYNKGLNAIIGELYKQEGYEHLQLMMTINTIAPNRVKWPSLMDHLDMDTMPLEQQLMVLKIQVDQNLEYDLSILEESRKETLLGNSYWTDRGYRWYGNTTRLTLLAYQIYSALDAAHPRLKSIRNYFLEEPDYHYRNTIEHATLLSTLLPALVEESGSNKLQQQLIITGSKEATVKHFPTQLQLDQYSGTLALQKTGNGPMYLNITRTRKITNPSANSSTFGLKNWLKQEGNVTTNLAAGVPATLMVELEVYKATDYLMVEVPIPAGCLQEAEQTRGRGVTHREDYKHKTVFFCERLRPGTYTFEVKLQPRFKGAYTVNPAQATHMYLPLFNGWTSCMRTFIE